MSWRFVEQGALARLSKVWTESSRRQLRFAFHQIGAEFVSQGQGLVGSRPGGLKTRSGGLARAGLRMEVSSGPNAEDVTLRVFITSPYGAAQEYGAEIRPVRARVLTIPQPAILDPSGIARESPREALSRDDTFFLHTAQRKAQGLPPVIARQIGEDLQILFVLATRVQLKPKWGLRELWGSPGFGRFRAAELSEAVTRAFGRAQG